MEENKNFAIAPGEMPNKIMYLVSKSFQKENLLCQLSF
jgi:hypothetical protein